MSHLFGGKNQKRRASLSARRVLLAELVQGRCFWLIGGVASHLPSENLRDPKVMAILNSETKSGILRLLLVSES